ncbi:MAG TPA: hypothetical protein VFW28_13745 [Micropepsaceae bacterium]|nr:hypothetical protein [Micropepsaceae bacterium]
MLTLPTPAIPRPPQLTIQQYYIFGSVLPPLSAPTMRAFPAPSADTRPSSKAITRTTPETNSPLQALSQALGCTLDKYEKLSLEQKTRCAGQIALSGISTVLVPTRDEQRLRYVFEREYARKQAPFLLPCIGPGGGLDFITMARCAADIALNGFDPDKLPTYAVYPDDAR